MAPAAGSLPVPSPVCAAGGPSWSPVASGPLKPRTARCGSCGGADPSGLPRRLPRRPRGCRWTEACPTRADEEGRRQAGGSRCHCAGHLRLVSAGDTGAQRLVSRECLFPQTTSPMLLKPDAGKRGWGTCLVTQEEPMGLSLSLALQIRPQKASLDLGDPCPSFHRWSWHQPLAPQVWT